MIFQNITIIFDFDFDFGFVFANSERISCVFFRIDSTKLLDKLYGWTMADVYC